MGNAQQLTWTVEADDQPEANYALFGTVAGKKVQLSGWLDSPQEVLGDLAAALGMGAPAPEPTEAPE